MALAIFDLDNTLLAGDSDHAWGEFLVEQGVVDPSLYKEANDQFLKDYQSGNLDILAYLEFALSPLTKQPIEELKRLRQAFYESKIKPIMLPKAFELLQQHRAKGDYLLIITATNRFVTELIAEGFGVDDLIATEPEIINHRYTGKIQGTPSFQEGKISRLNEWLESNHHSLSGAFFYSDSHNDVPLLNIVDNPIAVDPDDTLKQLSLNNKWPILSLRD
ncbi:MAG: HAD family hydrolase [Oleiphilus sp.]